jgi:predicted RNA-binding Zn ribbon-like protein
MSELISPPPAPGEGASVALALVNTEVEPRGAAVDLLPDACALASWLRARGLTSRRRVAVTDADLEHMRRLRTAVRTAFMARAAGRRPPRAAMAAINESAALVASTPRLRWIDGGPVRQIVWGTGVAGTDEAFARIAVNAISTLIGDRADRLRLCEAHGCNRMFIAEHRRRRWCSRTCGDRVRVARHHRKRSRSA